MGLLDIRDNPDYLNANEATKRAIFDEYSKDDPDYQNANQATKDAIRQQFGVSSAITTPEILTTEPSLGTVAEQQVVGGAVKPAVGVGASALGVGADIARNVYEKVTPGMIGQRIAHPVQSAQNMITGLFDTVAPKQTIGIPGVVTASGTTAPQHTLKTGIQALGQNIAGKFATPTQGLVNVGKGVGTFVDPASMFALPYQMAGYEQEKIRANPNAPEYATNPYAQMYRGEAPTQGAAGAMNRREAIAGQQYGGLTQEEQDILEQDRINRAIRRRAAERALGPIAPQGY